MIKETIDKNTYNFLWHGLFNRQGKVKIDLNEYLLDPLGTRYQFLNVTKYFPTHALLDFYTSLSFIEEVYVLKADDGFYLISKERCNE